MHLALASRSALFSLVTLLVSIFERSKKRARREAKAVTLRLVPETPGEPVNMQMEEEEGRGCSSGGCVARAHIRRGMPGARRHVASGEGWQ